VLCVCACGKEGEQKKDSALKIRGFLCVLVHSADSVESVCARGMVLAKRIQAAVAERPAYLDVSCDLDFALMNIDLANAHLEGGLLDPMAGFEPGLYAKHLKFSPELRDLFSRPVFKNSFLQLRGVYDEWYAENSLPSQVSSKAMSCIHLLRKCFFLFFLLFFCLHSLDIVVFHALFMFGTSRCCRYWSVAVPQVLSQARKPSFLQRRGARSACVFSW
jgi:hypothetical protein